MFRHESERSGDTAVTSDGDDTILPLELTSAQVKRATRTRLVWSCLSAFCLLVAVVFLILVEIGDTRVNSVLNKIYFINMNIANIVPVSVPDTVLVNTAAETLGLHDFYTVGLWNYCEGYENVGVTDCSKTSTTFWFNPVAVIQSELLAGAVIALPEAITNDLEPLMVASHWMFPLFLSGVCLNFLMVFITPLAIYTRWGTLFIMVFTFLGALLTTVACIVATVVFIIFRNAITSVANLNIKATLGTEMFVFMWIAAGFSIAAWLIQLFLCCCCASRRDVSTGRKSGSKKAWDQAKVDVEEKPARGIKFRSIGNTA